MNPLKKLPFWRRYTTKQNATWWTHRKIDWVKGYLETWNHPHRGVLAYYCSTVPWQSMIEVGCASGPNLFHFAKSFPGRDIGGVDVNPDAIALARQVLEIARPNMPSNIAYAEVGTGDKSFLGDKCTDLILTESTLIYVGPLKIKSYLREFKRVARKNVVLYEFYSPSFWKRLTMPLSGYWAHNYKRLLKQVGFDDIRIIKLPKEAWPESENHQLYGHIIIANV